MQKHKWIKYLDSVTTEICDYCNTFRQSDNRVITYVHPNFGRSENEPDCPPVEPMAPVNDMQVGNLVGLRMGSLEWLTLGITETMNVYHEYENLPVATFHGHMAITFRAGVHWYENDLKRLLELHALWRRELSNKAKF